VWIVFGPVEQATGMGAGQALLCSIITPSSQRTADIRLQLNRIYIRQPVGVVGVMGTVVVVAPVE
jgi:hypothetical protein